MTHLQWLRELIVYLATHAYWARRYFITMSLRGMKRRPDLLRLGTRIALGSP